MTIIIIHSRTHSKHNPFILYPLIVPTPLYSIFVFYLFQSMFREMSNSFLKRELKTSEPRFKRLSRVNTPQCTMKATLQSNFPSVNKGNGFDNSKENLYYETHLTKVRSACRLDETTIVSKYLNTIRKDYDEMSKVGRREMTSMKLKKREIEFIRQKNKVYAEKREEIQRIIQVKEKEASEIRIKYQDAKMQTKTLEHIISRMKKDEIFYKQFGRIRDEQLHRKIKQAKFLDETIIHQQEKLHKLMETLNDCKSLYNKNKDLREKKYEDFSGKIGDVKERDKFIQERKERTYELQSIELNDTLDEKNIHMREIILAHRVADSLLQFQVNSLIKQYSDIQGAFHIVKIKTGIHEPQLLTSKFFSYEQTAESLLGSISQNEHRILELNARKAKLSETYRNLMNDNLVLCDSRQLGKLQQGTIAQRKESLLKETNDKKLMIDQIMTWVDKRLTDFHSQKSLKEIPLEKKFQQLCRVTKQNSKKYQSYDFVDKRSQTTGIRLKKFVKEMSAEEISLRIRETEEMNESNLIEEEFIQTSRQNVLRKGFSIKHVKRDSNNFKCS